MRRFLSLMLCVFLACGLCACQEKEPMEGPGGVEEVDVPEVTAEELLQSNYGVEQVESLTLGLEFTIKSAGYTGSLAGIYEQTGSTLHMAIDEVDTLSDRDPIRYDLYYTYEDDTFRMLSDNTWVTSFIDDYGVGFDRLKDIDATEMVQNPEVQVSKGEYIVDGTCDYGVVADLLSFMMEDRELSDAEITTRFVYDDVSRELKSMQWRAHSDDITVIIGADVSKINETTIVMPIAYGSEAQMPEVWPDDLDDPRVDRVHDEVTMAEELTGDDYVTNAVFTELIGERFADTHEGVLFTWRWFLNSYSKQGFVRYVASEYAEIEEQKGAAVLVCWQMGLSYDILWENSFMSEDEVVAYRVELLGE